MTGLFDASMKWLAKAGVTGVAAAAAILLTFSGESNAQSNIFARATPWIIYQDAPGACRADMIDTTKQEYFGQLLRFELSSGSYRLISDYTRAGTDVLVLVDGRPFPLVFSQESDAVMAWIDDRLLSAVRDGMTLNLNFEPGGPRYSLGGSAEMLHLLAQCGRGQAPFAPASLHDSPGWVQLSGGQIDGRAFPAGRDTNGKDLFVCVADYQGGRHPGKIAHGFGGCNFSYGGQELTASVYSLMVGKEKWFPAFFHTPPNNSLPVGMESDGRQLYACRTEYNGSLQLGKTRQGFDGCNFGYGGGELVGKPFEVIIE
ncbi:DUF3421 domain-containing protein [Hoeflea sp. WL0058]|uniref:DUF3421 domain-containing protein n=1 Tax=Flavimaribacter sediminis TaxID=2865987 RepID=A0AAE2ZJ48_9HYPH|nr:DUF3421 domain-containing protein [Flavimaribacter sediminis]MBW8637684.1 DUF3421 domain-containing protein [Flavimaribacter sediminis]